MPPTDAPGEPAPAADAPAPTPTVPEPATPASIDALLLAAHPCVASLLPADFDEALAPLWPDHLPGAPRNGKAVRTRHTPRRRLLHAIRAQEAATLRIKGHSLPEIAEKCGYASIPAASYAVSCAMKARTAELADEVLQRNLALIDMVLAKVVAAFDGGDLTQADRIGSIIDRKQRMLGLNAPVKVAATKADGTDLPPTTSPEGWAALLARATAINAAAGLPTPGDYPEAAEPAPDAEPAPPA